VALELPSLGLTRQGGALHLETPPAQWSRRYRHSSLRGFEDVRQSQGLRQVHAGSDLDENEAGLKTDPIFRSGLDKGR
jgi:hypothetical protein